MKDSKDNSLINNEAAKRKKLVKQSISEMNRKNEMQLKINYRDCRRMPFKREIKAK